MSPTHTIEIDEDVPAWVEDYLAKALGAHVQVINRVVVRNDRRRLRVLVNTTEGSALLEKTRTGEPRLIRLPVPGERFSTTCIRCNEWIELHEPQTPRSFHCTRCAKRYMLTRDHGTFLLLTDIRDTSWREGDAGEGGRPLWERVDRLARQRGATEPDRDAPRLKTTPPAEPAAPPPVPTVERRTSHYEVNGYRLYTKQTTLNGGRQQRIYFFSKDHDRAEKAVLKPRGYRTVVTARTGLPVLRRAKPGENEDEIEVRKAQKQYRPQCLALTSDDKQCRNSARSGSQYCASHRNYRPGDAEAAHAKGADTEPRVKGAKDTEPSFRHAQKKVARKQTAKTTKRKVAKKTSAKRAKKTPAKRAKKTPAKRAKKTPAKRAKKTPVKRGKKQTAGKGNKTARKGAATKANGKPRPEAAVREKPTRKETGKRSSTKRANRAAPARRASTSGTPGSGPSPGPQRTWSIRKVDR